MKAMDEEEQLKRVKNALNITGEFQDPVLLEYIREIKEYLLDAGVPEERVNSSAVVGVLSRGVSDLWNYGSGSGTLSPYFRERVIQLSY